jgi:hypothetical protein
MGWVPYGYVKYRAQFTFSGEPKMFLSTRADDAKKVFINGKFVAEASNTEKLTDLPLAKYAQPGSNLVEISYELFGAPNGGANLGELKGLESVGIGADYPSAKGVEGWQIQRHSALVQAWGASSAVAPDPAPGPAGNVAAAGLPPAGVTWTPGSFGGGGEKLALVPAFTWCRADFQLPAVDEAWKIPWKLTFDADCDALIYLNGKFIGRYVSIGPQSEFYLPEPYLAPAGANSLTFVLPYTDQPGHLRKLQVAPYVEYSVRRTRVEFEW